MVRRVESLARAGNSIRSMDTFATGMVVEYCGEYVRLTFKGDAAQRGAGLAVPIVASVVIPTGRYRECARAMLDIAALVLQ